MPRPIRIQIENAYYHVMNRGNAKIDIATEESDFLIFKKTLKELRSDYGVRIFSYCLMSNHYHLLIQTPLGNLTRAMRHFGQCYTQRFNLSRARDGHLFRGRYKAILIDGETYLRQVVRYINLNPVAASIVTRPEQYPWSSFMDLLDPVRHTEHIDRRLVLRLFSLEGDSERLAQQKLKNFVLGGNLASFESFYARHRLPPVMCDETHLRTLENLMDWNRRRKIEV